MQIFLIKKQTVSFSHMIKVLKLKYSNLVLAGLKDQWARNFSATLR